MGTRLGETVFLAETERESVGALAEAVELSQSSTSQHLCRLHRAGVVTARRAGHTIIYRANDERIEALLRTLLP